MSIIGLDDKSQTKTLGGIRLNSDIRQFIPRWTNLTTDLALIGKTPLKVPLSDILTELSEHVGCSASMFANFEFARKPSEFEGHFRPRIEISIGMTPSKDLSAAWAPETFGSTSRSADSHSDFTKIPRSSTHDKPGNEFIHLTKFSRLPSKPRKKSDLTRAIHHHILLLTHSVWADRIAALRIFGRARLKNDFVVVLNDNIADYFYIESVKDKEQRESAQFIADFQATFGTSMFEIAFAVENNCDQEGQLSFANAAKQLKPNHPKITSRSVEEAIRHVMWIYEFHRETLLQQRQYKVTPVLRRLQANFPDAWENSSGYDYDNPLDFPT